MSKPRDWYQPAVDASGQRHYWISREGVILLVETADGDVAMRGKVEIAQVVEAWFRGQLLPRSRAPTLASVLDEATYEPGRVRHGDPEEWHSEPVEIVGGTAGLQKYLIALAEENRGLDHAALKKFYQDHEVVVAVWRSTDAPGMGMETLKGAEYLLAQAKRGSPKKIRASITAIPCLDRNHAKMLQQAFGA